MSDLDWNGDDPILMGIVNVTPDSFSDGGRYLASEAAIAHGLKLRAEGAQILDIGGESTRPGAAPVSVEEEIARVVPVIEGLAGCGALLSVDTRNAITMRAACAVGAGMINDISALTHDPDALVVAAGSGAYICLMHMQGEPQTMQAAPSYEDVFAEVYNFLEERIGACVQAGVNRDRLVIDPGIGFGKNLEHNLILLNRLDHFKSLGVPLLLGASRKRFIESLCPDTPVGARLPGSLAACLAAYTQGISAFRVHDVAETAQALTVYRAMFDQQMISI